jgi:hypothetical protein
LAELIERGRKTSALQLAESLQERVRLVDSVSTMFREIDLLLTPTLPFPVPRLDRDGLSRRIQSGIAATKNKNLTQSRLRPISPFSYVGQGRKGAKKRERQNPREPYRFIRVVIQRTQRRTLNRRCKGEKLRVAYKAFLFLKWHAGKTLTFANLATFFSKFLSLCAL